MRSWPPPPPINWRWRREVTAFRCRFPLPIYDGDLQSRSGVLRGNLKRMMGRITACSSFRRIQFVGAAAAQECHRLVSRCRTARTRGSVSRRRLRSRFDRLGGVRCLAALRLILTACHALVIPNQLALPFASAAYDDMDRLKHPADIEAMGALARQLIDISQRMM
jgi:hypothetical protein